MMRMIWPGSSWKPPTRRKSEPEEVLRDINEGSRRVRFRKCALDQIEARNDGAQAVLQMDCHRDALDRLPPMTLVQVMTEKRWTG